MYIHKMRKEFKVLNLNEFKDSVDKVISIEIQLTDRVKYHFDLIFFFIRNVKKKYDYKSAFILFSPKLHGGN